MKKLALIIGVVGIVGLSSCKKEVTCCVYDGDTKVSSLSSSCFTGKYSKAQIDTYEAVVASGTYSWKCK
ncbi:MAG: hypothetical protein ACPGR5_02785 [Chitinophagales bacterium]